MPLTWINAASTVLACVGGTYALFLSLLTIPAVQRTLIYLHRIRLCSEFDHPEQFGFAPGKVRNFELTTPDGERIGVWHVLPESEYDTYRKKHPELLFDGPLPEEVFDQALRTCPTVIYFHGNAATRAAPNRVRVARHVSEHHQSFVIIDYRGFGTSTGIPTEEGLLTDARTVWDWVTKTKGVPVSKVTVMGQSLGTGVSGGLVARLADEDIHPHALILVAPFSSVSDLLSTYRLGNFIPILSPVNSFPPLMSLFLRLLHTKFDTSKVIATIKCPILILHARDDPVIPYSHSNTLANLLLAPLLTAASTDPSLPSEPKALAKALASSDDKLEDLKKEIVKVEKWGAWGKVTRFERGEGYGRVVWAESEKGQHNDIGYSEPSLYLQREMMS